MADNPAPSLLAFAAERKRVGVRANEHRRVAMIYSIVGLVIVVIFIAYWLMQSIQ
jgi:hypothetical protein